MYKTKRQEYEVLRAQLNNEASSFMSHWRDLGDYILPRRPRFYTSDVNRGDRRNQKIIDSTATLAARNLRSGMMSGITSPARPWFRVTLNDLLLAESQHIKQWLYNTNTQMIDVFVKSNLYNALPIIYGDIGVFGTSALFIEKDPDFVIRTYPLPIGSYKIALDQYLKVRVFFREFKMTVRQLVEKFGEKNQRTGSADWSNFSHHVKHQYDQSNYETWIDVCHVVGPNKEYSQNKLQSKYKKFSSCYYEQGSSTGSAGNYMGSNEDVYLREAGYDYFPVLCPRWEVTGEDTYGTDCPGMTSLGDIKALQTMQKRKAQAVEKMVSPPMKGPSSLRTMKASILPGDMTYVDEREGSKGFSPVYEVNPRVQELLLDIQDHQQRIKKAFFEDLFIGIITSDRRQITAREIDERREEKLLALGPVLEQLNQDLLDPLIDIAFSIMVEQGRVPEPPEELSGAPLKIEYISVMSQAQKIIGVGGIERFLGFTTQAYEINPQIIDKINFDQMIDVYGDLTAIPPTCIRDDEETAKIRADRAQQQQQQAMSENLERVSKTAKNLGQTDMSGDNALTRLAQSQGQQQLQ